MNEITEKILESRKYKDIYPKTIDRIVEQSIATYGEKRAEKEAKEMLHQIWGSFYSSRPDFEKLLEKFSIPAEEDESDDEAVYFDAKQIDDLLRIHSSTVERRRFIDEFYQKIFEITGIPKTIQDIGCGFTPLSVKHMGIPAGTKYIASDIDLEEIRFLRKISKKIFKEYDMEFKPADIFADEFEYSDVIFLLKVMPILERQHKGATEEILDKLKCKFLVVSFPLKSLSGREVGMAKFYSENFEKILADRKLKFKKLEFSNELVYVIKK